MSLAIVIVLSSIALIGFGAICYFILHHRNRFQLLNFPNTRVLLLTAHPDDEVMFFAPTIQSLVDKGFEVHLLCLSSGNFDGLGTVRKKELELAGMNLGILKSNIFVEDFEDNPNLMWDPFQIANALHRSKWPFKVE
jgi:hypothetical protein